MAVARLVNIPSDYSGLSHTKGTSDDAHDYSVPLVRSRAAGTTLLTVKLPRRIGTCESSDYL
jgi:hypothetical protein